MALNADFFDKYPGETLDFVADATEIMAGGDVISAVHATSSDLTASNATFDNTAKTITFRVAGGVAGSVAKVVLEADMASGQIRQRPVFILVKPL